MIISVKNLWQDSRQLVHFTPPGICLCHCTRMMKLTDQYRYYKYRASKIKHVLYCHWY